METINSDNLIAACGMNCSICMVYLRERNKCPGCRASDKGKPITRVDCGIKNCDKSASGLCFDCAEFPCKKLIKLDLRYRLKYNMSMIDNLKSIHEAGISKFLETEKVRWSCSNCGGTINVHKGVCSGCGEMRKMIQK
jgi:hypothetical protein